MKLTRGPKTTKNQQKAEEKKNKQQQRGNKSIIAQGKQIFISFCFGANNKKLSTHFIKRRIVKKNGATDRHTKRE